MKKLLTTPKILKFCSLPLLGLAFTISGPSIAGETLQWSYGGQDNPSQWGSLGEDFALCELGRDQSPINIDNAVAGTPAQIQFDYQPTPLVVVNNGHTIQVNMAKGNSVNINGEAYELLQFHFHTPSEHTTSGKAAAMELHLVHQNNQGQLGVIGIMMNEGATHSTIDQIWKHIPAETTTVAVEGEKINAAELLPSGTSYVSYAGSLTTPPCSEQVKWYVLVDPIEVSGEQIAAFENLYQVNARPVQPTNGRLIQVHQ